MVDVVLRELREAFDAWLARILGNPDIIHRVVEADGEPVATIATFTIEGDREVTYWVDRARWGQGIASAALTAMLELEPMRPLRGRAASANAGRSRCCAGPDSSRSVAMSVSRPASGRGRGDDLPPRLSPGRARRSRPGPPSIPSRPGS